MSKTKLWLFLAIILIPANVYLLFGKRGPEPLAQMGTHKLRQSDLSKDALSEIQNAQVASYAILERQIEGWASTIAFESEARRTQRTVDKLLQDETVAKEPISQEEVLERYRQAPMADQRPYPGVLDEIRRALQAEKSATAKRAYVATLLQKEGLKILASRPEGYVAPTPQLSYPVYSLPPVDDLVAGRVVASPSKGPADASVVLEIYSDFMCPFSRKFTATSDALQAKYPDRLRVVFHHFPLPMHKGAEVLAEASVCAQEQGKFWPMHDALMAWQGAPDRDKLVEAAQKIGAESQAFSACLAEGRYANFVKQEIQAAQRQGVGSTPTFFLNGRKVTGALPVEKLTPLVDWFENPKGEYPGKALNPQNRPQGAAPPDNSKPVEFPKEFLSSGPSRGPADAPVTLIEFIDFNCPFCQRGAQAVDPLVSNSKVPIRFLSKQLPLPMHPNAEKSAIAALCSHEQGKYWPFRDEIFGAFWGKQTSEDMKAIASKIGLDRTKFDACLDGAKTLGQVKKDMSAAGAAGASGTPTYFINGRRVVGANASLITQILEEASAPPKK